MSSPMEPLERKRDEDSSYDMLDAIAEDLLEAIESRNKKLLKGALEALCEHIQEVDEIQDANF